MFEVGNGFFRGGKVSALAGMDGNMMTHNMKSGGEMIQGNESKEAMKFAEGILWLVLASLLFSLTLLPSFTM